MSPLGIQKKRGARSIPVALRHGRWCALFDRLKKGFFKLFWRKSQAWLSFQVRSLKKLDLRKARGITWQVEPPEVKLSNGDLRILRDELELMITMQNRAGSHDEQGQEDIQGGVLLDTRTKADKPHLYRVILHNDDYTPMDFVVEILRRFFMKTAQQATEIMLEVHHKGYAVCGVYPYDIAETKVTLVIETAKKNEYPLQCTMEKVP